MKTNITLKRDGFDAERIFAAANMDLIVEADRKVPKDLALLLTDGSPEAIQTLRKVHPNADTPFYDMVNLVAVEPEVFRGLPTIAAAIRNLKDQGERIVIVSLNGSVLPMAVDFNRPQ